MADEVFPPLNKKIKDRKVILTDGSEKKLSELSGKNGVILYFYPKDSTPGCTTEACGFRDAYAELKKKGWSVVGVSPDSPASHQKFATKQSLNFSLISDQEKELCEAFGVWVEKKLYGRTYMGVARVTFLLDPTLKLLKIYEKVKVKEHSEQILKDLDTL